MTGVITHSGINYPTYKYLEVSDSHVKRFGKSLVLMEKLNGSEIIFLYYLTEVMDHSNQIIHNHSLRSKFKFYMNDSDNEFTDLYVKKLFLSLTKTEFLLSSGKKGTYHINPIYFTKNNTNREKLITELVAQNILSPF